MMAELNVKDIQTIALTERIDGLESLLETQDRKISLIDSDIKKLQKNVIALEKDIAWIQENFPKLIAEDRHRLAILETVKPSQHQIDKGKILISLLAANNGKMSSQEARQTMGLSKQSFSSLLDTLPNVESRLMKTDKRRRLLVLK
jgi:hypothetical protein